MARLIAWLACATLAPQLVLAAPAARHRAASPSATAAPAPVLLASPVPAGTDVRVERVRPRREARPTLRFLRENRDFIRAALDRTRQHPGAFSATGVAIDPRFLTYRELLAAISASRDSVLLADRAAQGRDLFRSVTELGELESQLDQMDRQLAAQRARLGMLQADFTGDQRTSLAVVLSGWPQDAGPTAVALTLDNGATLNVPLSEDQGDALRHGGAVQIFHGYVEPREQVVQIALTGGGNAGDAGFVTLEPPRDRLMLLRLDLSSVRAADGAPGIHASTWLNDARVP